ncbi:transcription elongation regulator 1-like protein isoform X1 [Scomber scombrus]|uniref:Transcription elongation regulator 1-like protein isoform X1 n=2 Tax=Scomber scombrus TaxID=13677 RepID=A0AAV1Q7R4_SCOSC
MMLPVSRFKGHQPVGMVTTTTMPWLSINSEPAPHWLWLASWSGAAYQATPPLVFYPPAVWIPEHTHLVQWERPPVEVVPLLPPFYRSTPPLHPLHPLPKLAEGWISPEEVGVFQRRDKHLRLTNQIIQRSGGHALRTRLLLSPSRLSGRVRKHATKTREAEPEDSSSSSSSSLHLLSVSPLLQPLHAAPPPTETDRWKLSLSDMKTCLSLLQQCMFGPVSPSQLCIDKWPVLPFQVSLSSCLSLYHLSVSHLTFSLSSCVSVSLERGEEDEDEEEEEEEGDEPERKDKRPVASTPVPGSPWCVVWTGDDRVFFFNPTMHLSVWERPGELIGRDISQIIEDPPHKRKKMTDDSSCHSPGLHGDDNGDEHNSKRNRTDDSMSLVPRPGDVKLLPLELRITHFREMMLERGVSAFSTWEKELHKMVFDPRYLLLTSDQRKQVFDQFVKSRVKDEYKEKKSKLHKAREEFKQLLEEAKITSRSTFKEFCVRYRGDRRFNALNRKKEQEVLFNHCITSLKRRDKENRARLRKMR